MKKALLAHGGARLAAGDHVAAVELRRSMTSASLKQELTMEIKRRPPAATGSAPVTEPAGGMRGPPRSQGLAHDR